MLEFNLSEMDDLLNVLKGGVSTKSTGFELLYFADDKLCTFNDEVAVSVKYKTYITALIPFIEFHNAVKKLKGAYTTATLETPTKDSMRIKTGRSKITLAVMQDDAAEDRYTSPQQQLVDAKWQDLPENFTDIITVAAECAAESRGAYMMSCVYINRHDIFGSDMTGAYWAEVPETLDTMAIVKHNVKYIANANPDKYVCTEGFYHFLNSHYGCIISVRKINGTYPDYKQFFGKKGGTVTFNSPEAKSALELATLLLGKEEKIKVTLQETDKGSYFIVTGTSVKGKSQARFPVQVEGDMKDFYTTPAVLKRCFANNDTLTVSEGVLECKLQDGTYVISLSYE